MKRASKRSTVRHSAVDERAVGLLAEIQRRGLVLTYALEGQSEKLEPDPNLLEALAGLSIENEEAIAEVEAIIRARVNTTQGRSRATKGGDHATR